ncbi:MAG: NAD(P)H-hydrate dehydratase [Nitrospiraceae bacterium]
MKLVTAAQMQALDRRTIDEAGIPSLTLMERAGDGTVAHIEARWGVPVGRRVAILCGKGHNGGDGLAIGRLLHRRGAQVTAWLLHDERDLAPDTRTMLIRFRRVAGARAAKTYTGDADGWRVALQGTELVIDALLGTGLGSPIREPYAAAIDAINTCGAPVVAVDLPSGLHADTGAILGTAVRATMTTTYGLPKLGLFLGDGIDCAGTVEVVDIGIPTSYAEAINSSVTLLTSQQITEMFPPRRLTAHKGTYGHLGIVAGSCGKTGAAALAARAALRCGAGLVTVAIPKSLNPIVETLLLEAMTLPLSDTRDGSLARSSASALRQFAKDKTALAVGPGIGQHRDTVRLIREWLPTVPIPCVVDADALNAVAPAATHLPRAKAPRILTPHPGEMARLAGLSHARLVNADRLAIATQFAAKHGAIVVLKGARTIVADPDGRCAINPTGNPGMATGGTGDVLTGTIAALLAQGRSPWDAACAGTYVHGLAGDQAAAAIGSIGLLASDVAEHLPHAISSLRA